MMILDIFNHYGYENQLLQLCEEQSELVQALNKYRRCKSSGDKEKLCDMYNEVVEELADVVLVISEFCAYLNINPEDVKSIARHKAERQAKRIKGEKVTKFKWKCSTCKHEDKSPDEMPCVNCFANDEWEAKK